jgi:hypothetical protein
MRLLLICVMLLAACGLAAAQGRGVEQVVEHGFGGPNTSPDPLLERLGKDQAGYSRSVTGKIVTLDSASRSLVIEGAGKTQLTFVIDARVQLRADKDTAMGGKQDLSLTDYAPGQVVRVSYRISDKKALAIRLKRARS